MKHLAAYLLLQLGGNATPSKDEVVAALTSVGIESSDDRLDALMTDLEGKDIGELIEAGKSLLANFGGGGGGGGGGGSSGGGADASAAEVAKPEEKEEEEEMDLGGGMDMFGGAEGGGGGGGGGDY
jgi:large subunit ribosomal protein LP2